MKAPAFRYCRPASLQEALELLRQHGDDARILAGGQSLLPALNMRLSSPGVLVDIGSLAELRGIRDVSGRLHVGALARHCEVERSPEVARGAPLLALAMPHVAHPPVRARGTFGGSLALADPAAEVPAVTLAHGATLVLRSMAGERRVAAEDFFRGLYETAIAPGELLVRAEFAPMRDGGRFVFRELVRRHGDFAIAGVALAARVREDRVESARLVAFGVADRPILARGASAALEGRRSVEAMESAAQAIAGDVDVSGDVHHDRETKLHLLRVLVRRAARELMAEGLRG